MSSPFSKSLSLLYYLSFPTRPSNSLLLSLPFLAPKLIIFLSFTLSLYHSLSLSLAPSLSFSLSLSLSLSFTLYRSLFPRHLSLFRTIPKSTGQRNTLPPPGNPFYTEGSLKMTLLVPKRKWKCCCLAVWSRLSQR